jgi:hypothetical protein
LTAPNFYAQTAKLPVLQGGKAIKQLKQEGTYDSLRQAVKQARGNGASNFNLLNSLSFELMASDGAGNDYFGEGVAISGNTAVVGSYWDDIGAIANQGSAYVFVRNGKVWTQQQQLTASDGAAGDCFGRNVAIDGNTIIVGSYLGNVGGNSDQGAAYIFVRSGTTWTQQQKLTAADGAASDYFGESISISGDTVIIGAQHDLVGTNPDQGSAYVFTRNGTTWTQQQKLTASDGAVDDRFGFSVSVSGNTAIVGAYYDNIGANLRQGSAYIFVRSGAVWAEQQKLTAADGAARDNFGVSVAVSGDTAIVGAWGDTVTAPSQGSAYIFTRGGGVWTQQQQLTASDAGGNDYFGWSVAISGNMAIVGAYVDDADVFDQGSAYLFVKDEAGWTQLSKLTKAAAVVDDEFGWSVAISGDTAIVGARKIDFGESFEQGAAYVFRNTHVFCDFDGDGISDIAVFHPDANDNNNYWQVLQSSNGNPTEFEWGIQTDKIAPADYDGDGRTDYAVWRENEMAENMALFYIYNSSNDTIRIEQFGLNGDKLSVGDWDGDGRADLSVYREGSQSYFFFRASLDNPAGNTTYLPWGISGDKPIVGDYDGDGKQDAAVFRPSDNTWYIRQSSDASVRYEKWGLATDKFVPADYDGDGKTDLAVFRDGVWYIRWSLDGQSRYEYFGLNSDKLVPADYDGDGKTDIAVCRAGKWYILHSSDGLIVEMQYGLSTDIEIPAAYLR